MVVLEEAPQHLGHLQRMTALPSGGIAVEQIADDRHVQHVERGLAVVGGAVIDAWKPDRSASAGIGRGALVVRIRVDARSELVERLVELLGIGEGLDEDLLEGRIRP